ncbi:MAG: ABC transporter permease [Verrucomicrobiae bacterium]|nr:ABC transporter permease [Verrucomicrobiae bacterium]
MRRSPQGRLAAVVLKEFIQMRRDRLTFAMMVGIPLMQLILFGFAINTDPKRLPTGIVSGDHSRYTRALVAAMANSGYFRIVDDDMTEAEADRAIERGSVQFALTIPPDFTRKLLRGERPRFLVEADGTDPAATSNALRALEGISQRIWQKELPGATSRVAGGAPAASLAIHARYNPEAITQYNIVPGLMGVVLTMTMVIITSLAITREKERGTMEHLLGTPVRPAEVMVGKIVPYIVVGYIQVVLVLLAAAFLFRVPVRGSIPLLLACALLFIVANLSVGLTFSTVAKNQLQAVQMSFFFFLPSILLSGFMFPFRGMPGWAQMIGSALPLTHFLRIVRGIMLKGNGFADVAQHLVPIAAFCAIALAIGIRRYRQTLD